MEAIFMNTEKSKTNEPHKFVLNFSQTLDLRSSDKSLLFKIYLFISRVKNIRKQYTNNKLKMIAPTWKDEYELPNGSYSVSDIQDYIEYIIKKHETSTAIPPIHAYINRINNRLVFKIKNGCKL